METEARELSEFEAKVLALEHGRLIWFLLARHELDGRLVTEFAEMLAEPASAIAARLFPNRFIDDDSAVLLRDATLSAAWRKLDSTLDRLWPEYVRLLKRNPREWKAYRKRYDTFYFQNPRPAERGPLSQERGRPRDMAARDELIYGLYQNGRSTDQQVANMLKQRYGIQMSRQAVRRAYDREKERWQLQAAQRNSR